MKLACLALLGSALLRGQVFSQNDLRHWLAAWQQKQQLQDWAIEITLAEWSELGMAHVGDTHFLGGKRARIRVLNAAECRAHCGVEPDKVRRFSELTVVHELVHLSVRPVAGDDQRAKKVDGAVEDIAEALFFGNVPACATPRDFMEAEIVSLPWQPVDAGIREQVIRKLTAAFLDGRPSWMAQHAAGCAYAIKTFFARSGWR
jgi:hypothetical protein